jgi:HAD superfamily hydrolase (TIGR01509 family)
VKKRLPVGKVPWDLVADRVRTILPPEVTLGPSAGEDAALVEIGGETWAIASDPVTFASQEAGRLAVIVNANDVAVRGATPRLFLAVVLVAPDDADADSVGSVLDDIREACESLGVALIGGHTEVTPGLSHTIVVGTMLGPVRDRTITTGGLKQGDRIGLTGSAGMEGTSILLDDPVRGDRLLIVEEARIAAANPAVHALHDVTEGGVGEALHELSTASGLTLDINAEAIPILPETGRICNDLGIDPLGLIGSGALLVGCADEGAESLAQAYRDAGVPFGWIGHALGAGESAARTVPRFERDEILKAYALDGIEAVVFDMDGTLIDSDYDWLAIRRQLGVNGASIIDELNGLPAHERERKWKDLREIERKATREARVKSGAAALIDLLRGHGLRDALVTNNTDENTSYLLEKFGLDFDVVLTRDSGLWKPSGAPVAEAIRRLGVAPEKCLAVGDSIYDLRAADEAACGRTCVLYQGAARYAEQADLAFADIDAFLRYLRVVLR